MWGRGSGKGSVSECFRLTRGWPNWAEGLPLLGPRLPSVSERGQQGCSPQQSCLPRPALRQGRAWDWPPSAWLREPAPLTLGYLLSILSRKESWQKLHFKTRFSPEVSTRCHLCLKLPSARLPSGTIEALILPLLLQAQRKGEPPAIVAAGLPGESWLPPQAPAAPARPGSRGKGRAVPEDRNSCPHVQKQPDWDLVMGLKNV